MDSHKKSFTNFEKSQSILSNSSFKNDQSIFQLQIQTPSNEVIAQVSKQEQQILKRAHESQYKESILYQKINRGVQPSPLVNDSLSKIRGIQFNHQNTTPTKNTKNLLKQAAKAATLQDIMKAKKFYRDDSSLVVDIQNETTFAGSQMEQSISANNLITRDPKKLEKTLNQLRLKNLRNNIPSSQTIDTNEIMMARKHLKSQGKLGATTMNLGTALGFSRDISYLHEKSRLINQSEHERSIEKTQQSVSTQLPNIIEIIKKEKHEKEVENQQNQNNNNNQSTIITILRQEMDDLDKELYQVINERQGLKWKPPQISQQIEFDEAFSFNKFLEQKTPMAGQNPSSRRQAQILQAWFDMMIDKYYVQTQEWQDLKHKDKKLNLIRIQKIIDTCLKEIVKQTMAHCQERGKLLEQLILINEYFMDRRIQQVKDEKVQIIKNNSIDREKVEKSHDDRINSLNHQIFNLQRQIKDSQLQKENDVELVGILRLRIDTINGKLSDMMRDIKEKEKVIEDFERTVHILQIKNQKYKEKKRILNRKIQDQIRFEQVVAPRYQHQFNYQFNQLGRQTQDTPGMTGTPSDYNRLQNEFFEQKRNRVMSLGRQTDRISFAGDLQMQLPISQLTKYEHDDLEYSQSNNQEPSIRNSIKQIRILDQSNFSPNQMDNMNQTDTSKLIDQQSLNIPQQDTEEILSNDQFLLVAKDEEMLQKYFGIEDEEEAYIKRQVEIHKLQDEMMKSKDFTYFMTRVDELCTIYQNQLPKDKKSDKQNEYIKEIVRQLFKNEIEMIANFSKIYNDKLKQLMTLDSKSTERRGVRTNSITNIIYQNNPNFVKRKMVVYTYDIGLQTEESMLGQKLTEAEIENKVASKLIQMLISKGVTKIIKKYGYLPIDYINKNTGTGKTPETTGAESSNTNTNSKSQMSKRKSPNIKKESPAIDKHSVIKI